MEAGTVAAAEAEAAAAGEAVERSAGVRRGAWARVSILRCLALVTRNRADACRSKPFDTCRSKPS
jgi:hypothetical protein